MSVFSELVTDHFFNPRNVGDADEPSFTGRAASLVCGAHVRFSIQVDECAAVSQAKFKAVGCNVLVAAASLLAEKAIGRSTAEAATTDVFEQFAGLESQNAHCPRVARDALLAAIREYSDAARDEWSGDEALICTCFFVSERTIEREIATAGLKTVAEVTRACNAGGGCGSCHQLIQEILETQDDLP